MNTTERIYAIALKHLGGQPGVLVIPKIAKGEAISKGEITGDVIGGEETTKERIMRVAKKHK